MAGLIGTGDMYRNQALSGFIRLSEEEQQRRQVNEQLKRAEKTSEMQTTASAVGAGISILAMCIALV